MKNYLKYFSLPFLMLVSGMASAQNPPCVTLDLSYSVELTETSSMDGQAVVSFQGNAYRMTGNGISSYCDGQSVWVLDMESKEVYIENLSQEAEEQMGELALMLSDMKTGSETEFTAPEGQLVRVRINSIKKSDGIDISSFRPIENFDSSWVVVDLR